MEKASYVIYVTILILSTVLFGAMHTYVYTLVILGVLLAALLLVLKGIRKERRSGQYVLRLQKTALNLLFVLMLGYLVFQLVPLPPWVLKGLSPEAWVVWQKSVPAIDVVKWESSGGWHTLAVYGYPVRMSLVRWMVYGFFFFGLIRVLNSRKRITVLVYWILCLGCFEALYGLMQAYSLDPHVWWVKVSGKNSVSGTYINRNHFAGLMGMGLMLAAAFAAGMSEKAPVNRVRKKKKPGLKERISALVSTEQRIQKRLLVFFMAVVMGVGLVFSASRGGIVAAAGGLLCMSLLFVFRKEQRRKGLVFLALFVIVGAWSFDIGMDYVLGRFSTIEHSYEYRDRLNQKTMEMFGNFPVVGVGIGDFQYAYPKYQDPKEAKKYVRFAHNDWAQFLSEGGILGMALLLVGLGVYIYGMTRLWRKRSDPFAVCLGAAPLAAMAVLAIHSFSDFNLHIPANFMMLVAIMAIGYAALHLERRHRRDVMAYRYYEPPLKYRGGVVLVLILGLIGWTGYTAVCHFMGEVYCHTVPNSTMNRDLHPPVEEVFEAVLWDVSNAEYHFKLAEALGRGGEERKDEHRTSNIERPTSNEKPMGRQGSEVGGQESEKEIGGDPRNLRIVKALERSVELNPFEAQYHLRLGWEYAKMWKEEDYHGKWLPAADISMDRAAYFAGVKNPHLHQELGNYWVMRSRSVMPNDPLHHEAWAKACWHYQKAQSLETGGNLKRMKKEIRAYVWRFYPDEEYLKAVLGFGF